MSDQRSPLVSDPGPTSGTPQALKIDAAAQSLVDLIEVLARLADGPQLGDAGNAYVVSEELDGRNTTADADRLLLHAANARTLLTQVLVLHHNAPRRGGYPVSKPPRPPRISWVNCTGGRTVTTRGVRRPETTESYMCGITGWMAFGRDLRTAVPAVRRPWWRSAAHQQDQSEHLECAAGFARAAFDRWGIRQSWAGRGRRRTTP